MADVARIGHFQGVRLRGRDEPEGMRPHVDVSDGLRDLRHMAADALVTSTTSLMVSMLLNSGGVWSVLGIGTMTIEAYRVGGFPQHRVVFRPMHIVATKAGHAARVH